MVAPSSASVFQSGMVLRSRYRLDEAIAVGGMAEVWRGHDLTLQRPVAIKLLHPHLAADAPTAERFRREAISTARLSHPNIVPTYDTGTDDTISYIVQGLIQGGSLAEVLKDRRLTESEVLAVGRQVGRALDYAHQAGVIHRDITPSNILLVNETERAMITDFGIAKAISESMDESLTLPGLTIGTPAFASPEQKEAKPVDARSDIYSLGVVLHMALCDHGHATDAPTQIASASEEAQRSSTESECHSLPDSLRPVIAKATALDPNDRYESAAQMVDALAATDTKAREAPARFNAPLPNPKPLYPTPVPVSRPRAGLPVESKNRWANRIVAAIVVLLVIASVGVGRWIAGVNTGGASNVTPTSAPATVTALTAHSFDPQGNGTEHEEQAANAVDGKTSTSWSTEHYNSRTFGTKSGVGLIIDVPNSQTLHKLAVDSDGQGWAAQIYVGDGKATTLEGWGSPVDTQSGLESSATFDLHNSGGRAILLWITDLGNANKVSISEVRLSS